MFQPYRYEKECLKPGARRSESKKAASTPSSHLYRSVLPVGKLLQALPVSMIMIGSGLISTQIAIPLINVTLETKSLVEPISAGGLNVTPPGDVLGGNVSLPMGEFEELAQIDLETPVFEAIAEDTKEQAPPPPFFYLDIPKLGIEGAKVETNSTSMRPDTSLGHYKGTGLPGGTGRNRNNSFVYGHSALPQYFSPTNYKTIFTTLPDLELGDEFTITYNEEVFHYKVEAKQVLKPEDVNPLNPVPWLASQQSYATLMTCVPPGGISSRLLVVGKLISD